MLLAMNSILFVDDDPQLLSSIRRSLRDQSGRWTMMFAGSAGEALDLMSSGAVDVVVSDFQMPVMSGLELLTLTESLYPRTLRVMLTGQPGKIKYSQTVNICHYFFLKPLSLAGFKRFLLRADEVLTLLQDERLIVALNAVTSLPIHPDSFDKLSACLHHQDIGTGQLAYIARKDIALAMQLFKLSSSANFALDAGINSLEEAITYLDLETIRSLLATQHTLCADGRDICDEFQLDLLQRHSFRVTRVAEALAGLTNHHAIIDDILLAALLHDVGRIALAHALPEDYRRIFAYRQEHETISFTAAEKQTLGISHAEVGAYLAALWGIPMSVVTAIHLHAQPHPRSLTEDPVSHLIWHANRLSQGRFEASRDYLEQLNRHSKWRDFFDKTAVISQGIR